MRVKLIWLLANSVIASAAGLRTIFDGRGFSVRAKKTGTDVCNGTAGVSGYIDDHASDSHSFFWMFESQNNPATDPVVLWMSGGPGGSSTIMGNLFELGPCRIKDSNSTVPNEFSWDKTSTVIFLDQPTNVGYSHGKEPIRSLEDATEATHIFLLRFFTAFPQYVNNRFVIAGESYGGIWVPKLASRILSKQKSELALLASKTSANPNVNINLGGIALLNSLMSNRLQDAGHYDLGCLGPQPWYNQSICAHWASQLKRCTGLREACDLSGGDSVICGAPNQGICADYLWWIRSELGRNPYNVAEPCVVGEICYNMTDIETFADSSWVKDALGVDKESDTRMIDYELIDFFQESNSYYVSTEADVSYILNQGLRVLVLVGNNDWLCTAAGMRYFSDNIAWVGNAAFRAESWRELKWFDELPYRGSSVWGWAKSTDYLTHVEVDGAGHMSPRDKPREVLWSISRWLSEFK